MNIIPKLFSDFGNLTSRLVSGDLQKSVLSVLVACLSAANIAGATGTSTPNILFIYTDDQSTRTVSCYPDAYNYADTPNIDSLADEGIRFDQAYMGAKCVPARAGMLTGRLQYDTRGKGDEQKTYWVTALRTNGYYTGMIGKWHWGSSDDSLGHGINWDWSVIWNHSLYGAAGGYYYDQKVMYDGAPQVDLAGYNTDLYTAEALQFVQDAMYGGQPEVGLSSYSTDRYTEETLRFIHERSQEPGQPWFFWLCYAGVHGPYTPADRHIGEYSNEPETRVPSDIYPPRVGKPSHLQDTRWSEDSDGDPVFKGDKLDFHAKQYTEAVASIDDGVGYIIQALKDTNQYDNTIIVFTSDQGFAWGQHGLKNKVHPYSSAIKSPLIISSPTRFPTARVCDAAVNGPDIIQTFHALTGTSPNLEQDLHGRDISPLLNSPESASTVAEWSQTPTLLAYTYNRYKSEEIVEAINEQLWDRLAYADKEGNDVATPEAKPIWFMSTDGKYKYIRYCYINRIEELYDVIADPEEQVNLALDPAHSSRLLQMRKALVEELKKKGGGSFADILPEPTSASWWPGLNAADNAWAQYGQNVSQPDTEELEIRDGWSNSESRVAYLRYPLDGANTINGYPIDSILSVSLDLWITGNEGDVLNDLQIFALNDNPQTSGLSETEWTNSNGAGSGLTPLTDANLPTGTEDPGASGLTSVLLGSHTFSAIGDNNELGLLQIPLSVVELNTVIANDSNGEITLILRSTSTGESVKIASITNSNILALAPTLTITARPDKPAGLVATEFSGSILLEWNTNEAPNLGSYAVYRTTAANPDNYTLVASDLTSPAYTDNSVTSDTEYFYVVTATDLDGNESLPSDEIIALATAQQQVLNFGNGSGKVDIATAGFTTIFPADGSETHVANAWQIASGTDTGHENFAFLKTFDNLADGSNEDFTITMEASLASRGQANKNMYRYGISLFTDSQDLDNKGIQALLVYDNETLKMQLRSGINNNNAFLAETDFKTVTGAQTSYPENEPYLFKVTGTYNGTDLDIEFTLSDGVTTKTVTASVDSSLALYDGTLFGGIARMRNEFAVDFNYIAVEVKAPVLEYQAENYTSSSSDVAVASNHEGSTGNGFVDFGGNGSFIEWNNVSAGTGTVTLKFSYANDSGKNRSCSVLVNGINAGSLDFADTGAGNWSTWATVSLEVELPQEVNTIQLIANSNNGGPNVDRMDIELNSEPDPVQVTEYQAEDYTATNGCTVESNHTGFNGSGFVDFGGNGTFIEWNNVNAGTGTLTLDFTYANKSSYDRPCTVLVNGTIAGTIDFVSTGSWSTWTKASLQVELTQAVNTIQLLANSSTGGPNVDQLDVSGGNSGTGPVVNTAPSVETPIEDIYARPGATSVSIDLTTVFSDAETADAQLAFAISGDTNPGVVTTTLNGSTLTVENFVTGKTTIEITATDDDASNALSTTESFTVDVAFHAEDYDAGSDVAVRGNHSGFTGSGFVDFGGSGSFIEWQQVNTGTGAVTLEFRYANKSGYDRPCAILVNGTNVGSVNFVSTGNWSSWSTVSETVTLTAPINTIALQATTSVGGPNVDKMEIVP